MMQNSIIINGMSIDQLISKFNHYKSENERLKNVNNKMQEQLKNQGRQLKRLKHDNERYQRKLNQYHGASDDVLGNCDFSNLNNCVDYALRKAEL